MTAQVRRLPFVPTYSHSVPLMDLPGVLTRLTGPQHQPVRVETFPGATSTTCLELARCRCGRLFTAEAMTRHLTEGATQ